MKNELQRLEEKYKELGKEIEKLKIKPSNKRWRAKKNKDYSFISDIAEVINDTEAHHSVDDGRYSIGNYYETEELAELAISRQLVTMKVLDRLRELEGDWEADWNDGEQNKYRPYSEISAVNLSCNKLLIEAPKEWYSTHEAWSKVKEEMHNDIKFMITGENNK